VLTSSPARSADARGSSVLLAVKERAGQSSPGGEPAGRSDEGFAEGFANDDPPRVLVVEDDLHIGRLVERILMREGFLVVRVMDVVGAWAVLEAPEAVDLLFTDVVLPGASSGADLAARLREQRPDLPIILTTGYDQSRISDHPGLLDTVAFLRKPFTAVQVRDLVRQELGRA